MQMNGGKLVVMRPESDADSELPLTSFDVTHHGLAAVIVAMFLQPTSHPDIRETD